MTYACSSILRTSFVRSGPYPHTGFDAPLALSAAAASARAFGGIVEAPRAICWSSLGSLSQATIIFIFSSSVFILPSLPPHRACVLAAAIAFGSGFGAALAAGAACGGAGATPGGFVTPGIVLCGASDGKGSLGASIPGKAFAGPTGRPAAAAAPG